MIKSNKSNKSPLEIAHIKEEPPSFDEDFSDDED